MEIKVPLEIVLSWLGDSYKPNRTVYQIDFCGSILDVELFEDYAQIQCIHSFSINTLMELSDHMDVVGLHD